MTSAQNRSLRLVLLGLGLVCGLVLGPLLLFVGIGNLDSGGLDRVGAWLMVIGGSIAAVGGLAVLVQLRRKPS